MQPNKKTALYKLAPDCTFSIRDPSGTAEIVNWLDNGTGISQPTEAEIDAEVIRLQAEYDAQAYARKRASAYASVGDQLDQIMKDMKNGTKTHQTACEAVKTKYPKE
jgi:hypothetical protein